MRGVFIRYSLQISDSCSVFTFFASILFHLLPFSTMKVEF